MGTKVHLNYTLESRGSEEDLEFCLDKLLNENSQWVALAKGASQTPRCMCKWVRVWIVSLFLYHSAGAMVFTCSNILIEKDVDKEYRKLKC